jgi:hypothetical protein
MKLAAYVSSLSQRTCTPHAADHRTPGLDETIVMFSRDENE